MLRASSRPCVAHGREGASSWTGAMTRKPTRTVQVTPEEGELGRAQPGDWQGLARRGVRSQMAFGLAASGVSLLAFAVYRATLLPGFDLGDTGSFQHLVNARFITPREAYPLYFAIGKLFVAIGQHWNAEPAWALNLASAVAGGLACGALTWAGIIVTGRVMAGLFAGLLFAFSFTFWSQAIIAEVYALHVLMMAAALGALLWWGSRPGLGRLALFFAIYALGFGNHLSMILLAPGFTLFLLLAAPGGPGTMLRPRVVGLAAGIAALGSLQYAWNLSGLYAGGSGPPLLEALRLLWFDVTKADWRESLVLGVPLTAAHVRLPMYWFDLRQQFGAIGIALAVAGIVTLARSNRHVFTLLVALYAANLLFALTYNVGDVHVFLIPSHVVVALFAACGAAAALRWTHEQARIRQPSITSARLAGPAVALSLLLYPGWRLFDTYPVVDRSADLRPLHLFEAFTHGLTRENALIGTELDWQLHNGLSYFAQQYRPDLRRFRFRDALPDLPVMAREHAGEGRDLVLSERAADAVRAAHGPVFDLASDEGALVPPFSLRIHSVSAGTPYVLALLSPMQEFPFDQEDVDAAARRLGGRPLPRSRYTVMVGRAGQEPVLVRAADGPYRVKARIGDLRFDIRMESWLPADTMRRAGFGRVVLNGRGTLILERGVSFATFFEDGATARVDYTGGLFAPLTRYIARLKEE
jgi:hypothetical protein